MADDGACLYYKPPFGSGELESEILRYTQAGDPFVNS